MFIDDLAVPAGIRRRLSAAGFSTIEEVSRLVPRELRAINGIGPEAVDRIESALAHRGLHLAADAFTPYICEREGRPAFDVRLTDLWLCDTCATDFQDRVFLNIGPEYVGPAVGGYCGNCVQDEPSVALRQWFLCENCARVSRSFGQSVIASRGLLQAWNDGPRSTTGIELVDVDPPRLNRRTTTSGAAKVAAIDFEGRRVSDGAVVVGIEQKTGQKGLGYAAVDPMSEFQLDCSDCDDIAAVAERERLPVLLVHAQAVQRATPPTRMWVPVGYWWTDPFAMRDSCTGTRNRGREIRPAAYYPVSIFRPLVDLAAYLAKGGLADLNVRLAAEGRFPALYPGQLRQI